MVPFKKRETVIQNISYMAIMAAINVIFVLLTTFIPVLFILLVFILPLTSAIVTLYCKKRYFPIYALATIALCLICTIWKIDDTIFYVIPSIATGFIFGLLAEKKVPAIWIVTITTVLQIGFTYASIPLVKLITGQDIIMVFATAFGINDFVYLDYVVPSFIFFMALGQQIISYSVIREELPKFGYSLNEPKSLDLSLFISLMSFLVLTLVFSFIYGPVAYLFGMFALLFGIYALVILIMENNIIVYISLGGSALLSIFLFALLYPLAKQPLGLLFINVFFFLVAIIVLINNYLLRKINKGKIGQ